MNLKQKIFLGLLGVTSLLLGGLLAVLQFWLNSPAFQHAVIDEVARQTGCNIQVDRIKIHFGTGLAFEGIRVSSPQMRPQEFLQAEQLRVDFNFLTALLRGKIIPEEVKITGPVVKMDLSDSFTRSGLCPVVENKPSQVSAPQATETPSFQIHKSRTPSPSRTTSRVPSPLSKGEGPSRAFNLKHLMVENGSFFFILPDGEKLTLRGVHLDASFSNQPATERMGKIACATAEWSHHREASDLKADFLWQGEGLEIPSFSGKIWGGNVSGKFKTDFAHENPLFELSLSIQGMDVEELLAAGGMNDSLFEGQLFGQACLKGSLDNPIQANGAGQVKIMNGCLINSPVLLYLSVFLNRPGLRNLAFPKCGADFLLQKGSLQIPRIQALSPDLEITGQGEVKLVEETQDFQMKFALPQEIAQRFPDLISKMTRRPDGFWEEGFRIWGPLDKPQQDLSNILQPVLTRIAGGSLIEKVYQGMERLMPSTNSPPAEGENPK